MAHKKKLPESNDSTSIINIDELTRLSMLLNMDHIEALRVLSMGYVGILKSDIERFVELEKEGLVRQVMGGWVITDRGKYFLTSSVLKKIPSQRMVAARARLRGPEILS